MTRRRWIADEVHGETAALTGEHAQHLIRVLRAKVGQEFDVAVGESLRRGRITAISSDRVEFSLGAAVAVEPAAQVTVALAVFKFDRMEWAIEKCTELGVARLIPVITRRTESHLASAAAKRHERWQRIARQAAEQSRGLSPPEIALPARFKDFVASSATQAAARIVLAEAEADRSLRDALAPSTSEVILAIGPEGGWTKDELQTFAVSGWVTASLGNTILRAETAAIVATALALNLLRQPSLD